MAVRGGPGCVEFHRLHFHCVVARDSEDVMVLVPVAGVAHVEHGVGVVEPRRNAGVNRFMINVAG